MIHDLRSFMERKMTQNYSKVLMISWYVRNSTKLSTSNGSLYINSPILLLSLVLKICPGRFDDSPQQESFRCSQVETSYVLKMR